MSVRYRLKKNLMKTDHSELYEVYEDSGSSNVPLRYIAKRYLGFDCSDVVLKYEEKVTHSIDVECKKSVLIPIIHIVDIDGDIYAIMKLENHGVFLSNLKDYIDTSNKDISVKDKLNIANELLITVEALHETGWLHLDIHPGNIFIEMDDYNRFSSVKVRLIDFSSAIRIEPSSRTDSFERMPSMTEGYSAPEVVYQKTGLFDSSTDIFSVIAVMNWMLYGNTFIDTYGCLNLREDEYLLSVIKMKVFNTYYTEFILDGLSYETNSRLDMEELHSMLKQLSDIEEMYSKSDYIGIIEKAYELKISEEERITDEIVFNLEEYRKAIYYLYDSTKKNEIDYSYSYYFFLNLWDCVDKYGEKSIKDEEMVKMISAGIACCNMVGDSALGYELLKNLQRYKDSIMVVDDYLTIRLRVASNLADSYNYKRALELVTESVEGLNAIRETRKTVSELVGMCGDNSYHNDNLARAYSAKACYLAFTSPREVEIILDYFERALFEFGDQELSKGNRAITISHILHYAIELIITKYDIEKGYDLFEKYDSEYLGSHCKDIYRCWLKLKDDNRDACLYRYFVFFKAIYLLYSENIKDEMIYEFIAFLNEDRIKNASEHPIEMIYKYVGLILLERINSGDMLIDDATVDDIFFRALTSNRNGIIRLENKVTTQMLISYQTFYIYQKMIGHKKENEDLYHELLDHVRRSENELIEEKLIKTGSIENILTFEYA